MAAKTATWTAVAIPSSIASHGLELRYGFFAPDATHGWLVGYDYDQAASIPIPDRWRRRMNGE